MVGHHSDRLIDRVGLGTADLALIGVARGPSDDLQPFPIASERLVAATPAASPGDGPTPHHVAEPQRLPDRVHACRDRRASRARPGVRRPKPTWR